MKLYQDLHCHTHLSVCGKDSATIPYYVESAVRQNIETVGIADHMWDKEVPFPDDMCHSLFAREGTFVTNWYKVQDLAHCREVLKEIEQTDTQGVRFLFGGEVDYCEGIGPAITEEEAEKMDFMIVPNSHTHHLMNKSLYEPYEKHAAYMLKATMEICMSPLNKYVTSLAHPFDATCCPYPVDYVIDAITDEQFCEAFCAAKEANIAAEINLYAYRTMNDDEMRNNYMTRVLTQAKKCGCKFTFGSDCHAAGQQDAFVETADRVTAMLGLTEEDILQI